MVISGWVLRYRRLSVHFYLTVQLQLLLANNFLSSRPAFFFFCLFCFLHAEYLTQVDLEEEKESQEMNARREFDKGEGKATTVPQLLEKLSRPGQPPFFYSRGLEILLQAVTDCECSSGRSFT